MLVEGALNPNLADLVPFRAREFAEGMVGVGQTGP